MATNFNVNPYYDDFDKTKNFHRVMFRPGYSVQARELTQLQTLIQRQINNFGEHIFEQGSMVIPGDINIDMEYHYLKLESIYNAQDVEVYRTNFKDKIITGQTTGVQAKVIGTVPSTDDDPITLYIKYENSGTDGETKVFADGETILSTNADNTTTKNPLLTTNQTIEYGAQIQGTGSPVGTGSAMLVHAGVYFVNGFFVENTEQVILLDKYSATPSYRMGWTITESFVTPEEDSSLLDNATGTSNTNAPGAHRFKINLTLTKKTLEATDDTNFLELARVNGGVIEQFKKYADYSELEHTLARRTMDESGSYEVRPYQLETREHLNDGTNRGIYAAANGGDVDKVVFAIEPGKAYVDGYELETITSQFVKSDKPRDFARVTDKPIQTPIGNYVLVTNVTGSPEIDEFEPINLYNDVLGVAGSGTIVGTARVRSFILHDGDFTGTLSETKFKLGLFDINLNDGIDFERDVKHFENSGNTFSANVSPNFVSLSGTATSSSSGTTVTGTSGSLFGQQLVAGDVIYLNDVLIGRVATTPTSNTSLTLTGNAAATITNGGIKRFSSTLVRPDQKLLVFPTNFFRVRKLRGDSTSNPDNEKSTAYTVRRKFAADTVSSGSIQFTVAGAEETFLSTANLQNFVLTINTATGGSARSAGDILDIGSSNLSLSSSDRTITISGLNSLSNSPCTDGDTVDFIASIRKSANDATEKSKTLVSDSTIDITGQSSVQNTEITLGKSDGYVLKSVSMSVGGYGSYSASNAIDITDRYDFDNGQRDAFYDLARVKLKSGQPAPTGSLRITFDYFNHTAGDYFSVDSYDGVVTYVNIPTYTSANGDGNFYELRDCVDFRPRIDDTGVNFTNASASLAELPAIGTTMEADFSYFLARKDLIFMDRLGEFDIIKGVPALDPVIPQQPDNGMVLFEVTYEPYVVSLNEILVKKIDNRRYTMRDIGKLDKRISNLEYYTSLNLLEKETADLVIKDSAGFDRLKNGFVVDNFTGHIIGDIKNPDYKLAVDMTEREARPMAFTDNVSMIESSDNDTTRTSANYVMHQDGIITLPYTHVSHINNPYASDSFDTNPYKVAAFTGEVKLVPYSDDWNDVTRRPDVVVNDDNNFDVIRELADASGVTGTVWNNWQDNWYGRRRQVGTDILSRTNSTSARRVAGGTSFTTTQTTRSRQVFSQQVGQVRSGIRTQIQSSVESNNLGDRITNISMIPFMRARPISFVIGNLKPKTKLHAFFDNETVTTLCRPADLFEVSGSNIALDPFSIQSPGSSGSTDSGRIDPVSEDSVQAFNFGDIIRNQTQSASSISGIVKNSSTVATITVASTSGIRPGHHVRLSGIGGSTRLNYRNSRKNNYLVTSVSGNTFTITEIDGSSLGTISSYTSGGSCQRLQASAHVSKQTVTEDGGNNRQLSLVNIINGFSVSDVLTGTLNRKSGGINQVTVVGINGSTSTTTNPSVKTDASDLVTDHLGNMVGVFYIPNTESLRFRTGERIFKVIDNVNASTEKGAFTSQAEKIYSATGIAEEREQTILNVRKAEFVRDRRQQNRNVNRTLRSGVNTSTRAIGSRFVADPPPPPPPQSRGNPGRGHDPLGQTFINKGEEGAFVTKLDLFFQTAGTRPVYVQLTDTIDGHPSNKIIAQKILQVEDINVSDDGSVATTFEFDSPVYLKDDIEYAFLVKVDEPGCRVFFSEVGATNLADGRLISSNPLTGTLFLSQNGSVWTPHQYRDVKFTLYRASFNAAVIGTPTFVNDKVSKQKLQTNPFEVNTNSTEIRVLQKNHGFKTNDKVNITGVVDGVYGANSSTVGIDSEFFNATHTVNNADIDSYTITVANSDIEGGTVASLTHDFVGGSNILASRNIAADVVQLSVSQVKIPGTDIQYRWTGTDVGYSKNATTFISENSNYYPTEREVVFSEENQNISLNGGRTNNIISGTSANVVCNMSTTSTFLTPVLDSERVSLCLTSNRISNYSRSSYNNTTLDDRVASNATGSIVFSATNKTMSTSVAGVKAEFLTLDIGKDITIASTSNNNTSFTIASISSDGATVGLTTAPTNETTSAAVITQHERYLDGIAPTGTVNASNYITKRFSLDNPATALKILFEGNRPDPCLIDVYYKIIEEGDVRDFDTIPYVLGTPDIVDVPDENPQLFREREYTISGLNSYSTAAVKIEFKSTSTIEVPRIKNLRIIALAL